MMMVIIGLMPQMIAVAAVPIQLALIINNGQSSRPKIINRSGRFQIRLPVGRLARRHQLSSWGARVNEMIAPPIDEPNNRPIPISSGGRSARAIAVAARLSASTTVKIRPQTVRWLLFILEIGWAHLGVSGSCYSGSRRLMAPLPLAYLSALGQQIEITWLLFYFKDQAQPQPDRGLI